MKKNYVFLFILLALLSGAFIFIKINAPIKIALVGDFKQERRDFCTTSILAARIAEKEINNSKRIMGKNLKVIPKDIGNVDYDELFKQLSKDRIELIISTLSSQKLKEIEPYLNKYNIVCISANSTAVSISKKEDNIYRLLPDDSEEISALMRYLEKNSIGKKFSIIYDKNNLAYVNSVQSEIFTQGGRIISRHTWDENYEIIEDTSSHDIKESSAVLILASGLDSAFIIQRLKIKGIGDKPIIGFSWNGDYNLIEYGGHSVEGVNIISPIDMSEGGKGYDALDRKLKDYNKNNGMIAATTYESIMLAKGIYENKLKYHMNIKDTFLKNNTYSLWSGESATFDRYGDLKRSMYIFEVKNGRFSRLEE